MSEAFTIVGPCACCGGDDSSSSSSSSSSEEFTSESLSSTSDGYTLGPCANIWYDDSAGGYTSIGAPSEPDDVYVWTSNAFAASYVLGESFPDSSNANICYEQGAQKLVDWLNTGPTLTYTGSNNYEATYSYPSFIAGLNSCSGGDVTVGFSPCASTVGAGYQGAGVVSVGGIASGAVFSAIYVIHEPGEPSQSPTSLVADRVLFNDPAGLFPSFPLTITL